MEIPSGYRFLPNHRELIECYLLNKVIGERVPSNPVIDDCDLYGDPEIWSKNFEQTGMKTLYFYTRLKRMTENGKQVGRATQFGTWRSQKDDPVFDSSQRHIGSHRTFSFKPKGGLELKGSRWTMHEFRLDGVYVTTKNPVSSLLSFFLFTTWALFLIVCTLVSFFLIVYTLVYFILDCLYISFFFFFFLLFRSSRVLRAHRVL